MVAKRFSENSAPVPPTDGIMELSLLISRAQFDALEFAAHTSQMTVAQYLRRIVQESINPASANTRACARTDGY
jgi:hypothetical protein